MQLSRIRLSIFTTIKTILMDLCKNVKRRTQKEDDDGSSKNSKTKPIIHINQEKKLRLIVNKFAHEDYKVLLDFLKLVQNILRGRI